MKDVCMSLKFGLFTLFVLLLVGCGGGGESSSASGDLQVQMVTSSIDFPGVARGGSLPSLKVTTSAKQSAVASDGSVPVAIFNEGPQYAEVTNAQGEVALMGFVSPTSPGLSARSTARALVYLAVAGGWMKEAGRLTVLEQIPTLAGFDALEAAVSAQVAADGALDLDDPEFQTALSNVVMPAIAKGRSVIAEPTSGSGLSLDTTVDDKLTVQNVYLRRVSLFLRRTGYKAADGQVVDEDNTQWTKLEMPQVARYGGITGTIDGYIKGEVAYSPVTSTPALDIPRLPADARETYYQLNAVGPGWTGGPSEDALPLSHKDELRTLELKTIFLDGFLVLLANVALPLKGDQVDEYLQFAAANGVITDIISNLRTTVPQVGELCGQGEYYAAFKALATSAYTSNTILPLVGQMTLDFLRQNSGLTNLDLEWLQGGMKGMLEKMGKIDIGFTLADSALLFRDFAASERAEVFRLRVTKGKVTLQANQTSLTPSSTTVISAIIQDRDPNGTYEFVWTVQPNNNYWVEDRHLVGTDDNPAGVLTTLEDSVNIRSLVTTAGVATVRCRAFRLDGGRREVGDDEITITFQVAQQVEVRLRNWQGTYWVQRTPNTNKWEYTAAVYSDAPLRSDAEDYIVGWKRFNSTYYRIYTFRATAVPAVLTTPPTGTDLLQPDGYMRAWELDLSTGYSSEALAIQGATARRNTMVNWMNNYSDLYVRYYVRPQ